MVKRLISLLCLSIGLWMATLGSAQAFTAIIYQPQTQDREIAPLVWQKAFRAVKQSGVDALVFQWTGYGEAFASPDSQAWLKARMMEAITADLKLIIGLYADPEVFSAVDVSNDLLEPYFLRLTEKNLALAAYWQSQIPDSARLGWYLPLEIDDRRWRAQESLSALVSGLQRDVTALRTMDSKPVYVSAFFRGNATPSAFGAMLASVKNVSGVDIWVQDGLGNTGLQPRERALYLAPFDRCDSSPVQGVVFEIFRQTGTDQAFKAKPLPPARLKKAMKQRAPCASDSVFFSLRYFYPITQK
jgi:hypothetical protein